MKKEENESFEKSWQTRSEAFYTHWTRSEPENQIQLAFRNHWSLFHELMGDPRFNGGKRSLEVGCGRGSLSCYFADAGFDCTLLDLSAPVIDIARNIFSQNGLSANFDVGDAENLPYESGSFDVVFSIGLLEHFEDPAKVLAEQVRILAPGGLFLGYVVPEYHGQNVQKDYAWINEILDGYWQAGTEAPPPKEVLFRSDEGSPRYLKILEKLGLDGLEASGVYPVPMISHSIDFPFSLMPKASELAWVKRIQELLTANGERTGRHPWLCEEGFGNAFLLWGYRPTGNTESK